MRIRNLALAGAIAAAVVLVPSKTTKAEAEFVANFGTVAPDATPWSEQLKEIKARVEQESGGRVKIKLFLGGTLGGEVEMVRDIRRNGRLQGGGFSTAAIAEGANVPLLQIPELPYLFRDETEADHVLDTVLWEPIGKELETKGFKLHAWAENGWRSFGTKGGAVKSPSDLAQYKMRCQEVDVHQKMYAALGTQAVTLPVSEVLTGLQTGIVDGFDNTPLFTQAAGWYEPIKFYSLTKHIYQPGAIIWSNKYWELLPPDLKTIILGDQKAEADKGRAGVRALEKELLGNFQSLGVEVVDLTAEERKAFSDQTRSVHLDFAKTVPGGPELLKAVNQSLKSQRGG